MSGDDLDFDPRHKDDFVRVYDLDDPRPYFMGLEPVDYRMPQVLASFMRDAAGLLREGRGRDGPLTVLDFACGYGGGLTRMKEHGNVLLTGAEKEELGILVFDVTSAPAAFVAENPELVSKFLGVTAATNEKWNASKDDAMLAVIAKESGMDLDAAKNAIGTMRFPARDEQLSDKWLGGNVQTFMKGVADVFKNAGSIKAALDTYENNVNVGPLTSASGM